METTLYNPAGQSKESLIANFVVRTHVFEKIFKDIRIGKMKYPEQHYIIQGQRGMGKTTLLLRLKYEIENTPELSSWLVPVFFNEESYDLTSLSNLWEKLLKYLDNLWETEGKYYKKTNEFVGNSDYEKLCFDYLQNILKSEKKKLIIFFDNFGQLFLDNLKLKEQQRLREILMNCADIRIIGASAIVIDDLYDYSKPFYEFFKIMNLEGLDKNETVQLISKLQENANNKIDIEKNRAKIETLAILTGGVIRTIMLVYEAILADQDGTALKDLETILDKITPLYKHKIEDLPVQQRKIVDVIARKWDAISTKEIAESIRENGHPMATKLISAQLQQLERNNIIEKKQTSTKNHLYQLKERFFNIWYLMRNGNRNDRCKVIWLTKFLEIWYDNEKDLDHFIQAHISNLRSGKYNPHSAIMMVDALTNISQKIAVDVEDILIRETSNILNDEQKNSLPKSSYDKLKVALTFYEKGDYNEAIGILESIKSRNDRYKPILIHCYLLVDQLNQALLIYKDIKTPNQPMNELLLRAVQFARCNNPKIIAEIEKEFVLSKKPFDKLFYATLLGHLYKKKSPIMALQYFNMAIDKGNLNAYQDIVDIYIAEKEYEKAESYCLNVISKGVIEAEEKLISLYIYNLNQLEKGKVLIDKGRVRNPQNPALYYYMGLNFFFLGEFANAKAEFSQAIKMYKEQNRISEGSCSMSILLLTEIFINEKKKSEALNTINQLEVSPQVIRGVLMKSIILIWNANYKEAVDLFVNNIDGANSEEIDIEQALMQELLMLFIAKKQYQSTLILFKIEKLNLKDRFKPIYYALLNHLKNELPNEYLKMGSELKQPVEDVLVKIEKMAIEYA